MSHTQTYQNIKLIYFNNNVFKKLIRKTNNKMAD